VVLRGPSVTLPHGQEVLEPSEHPLSIIALEKALTKLGLCQFQPTAWWLRTDSFDDTLHERLLAILDQTEQVRARRFASEQDRREFVACHALLRLMLSRIICRPPYEWTFSLGPYGKPSVAVEHGLSDLQFNITHTRGLVAVAVAWHHPIGVDVQIFESCSDQLDLAKQFFAGAEAELVGVASEFDRPRVFAQLWTLKEAYIKAIGVGLSAPLDSFAFALDPPRVQFRSESADIPATWQFASSVITDRHVLSVALHVPDQKSRRVRLSEVSAAELRAAMA
jgi:4'-phosphopantetheinyl transferase